MALRANSGKRRGLSRLVGEASERVLNVVDPNQVLAHVDVDLLLDRVDVNRLLDRVDVDLLLDRVDVNRLLDRVDVDALVGRADLDALLERVDVKALVDRAGIAEVVAESTGHITGNALDMVRRPLVGLDELTFRSLNRLVGRDPAAFPEGPAKLVGWVDQRDGAASGVRTGRYAGPLTRLLAAIFDALAITASFALVVGGIEFLTERFIPAWAFTTSSSSWVYGLLLGVWAFLYLVVSLVVVGKTPGKALIGLRVVGAEGSPGLHGRQAILRVLSFPLSLILFLGLIGVVFGRERRAWHDRLAGTAVVYDWGSRTASLPTPLAEFLERRQQASGERVVTDPSVT